MSLVMGTNAKALEYSHSVSHLNTRARDAEVLAGSLVILPFKNDENPVWAQNEYKNR